MAPRPPAEALAFDLYGTLVDPLAIWAELEAPLGPALAQRVAGQWRQKQLEYSFRLTVMHQYRDFEWVTARALDFALATCGASLESEARSQALGRYDWLPAFADAAPALEKLAGRGHQLVVLSNGSPSMVEACLRHSGLGQHLSAWLSVDQVQAFKPDPAVYRWAAERLERPIGEVRLVSSNSFDVVGAQAAGARTAWVNRTDATFDTIGQPPDLVVADLAALADQLG